jgi:hypothetical protein
MVVERRERSDYNIKHVSRTKIPTQKYHPQLNRKKGKHRTTTKLGIGLGGSVGALKSH